MPRVSFFEPGHNGDCSPLVMLEVAEAGLSYSNFLDEYMPRLLPIMAQVDMEGALIVGEDMNMGMWQVISLAEISIALHSSHPEAAEQALSLMLEAVKEADVHLTARAATFAEMACALTVAGKQAEAEAWLARARGHIADENNPMETVMGLSRYHLHRGELPEAVAALLSRPAGYSGNLTAFYLPFTSCLLSALAAAAREDLLAVLIQAVGDDFESLNLLTPYIDLLLAAGRSTAALKVVTLIDSYQDRLLGQIAAHAGAARDHALLERVVAAGRAAAPPDSVEDLACWATWEARCDRDAAKKALAPLLEKGLTARGFTSTSGPQCRALLQGMGLTGELDRALGLVPQLPEGTCAVDALAGIGEGLRVLGDEAGLAQVLEALSSQDAHSSYEVPGQARAALLLRAAGRHKEAAALLKALLKATRSTDTLKEISRACCAAGDLPGAVAAAKKIRNRRGRDTLLRPIAVAYARAGDLAGAKKVLGELHEDRLRGFVGTEVLEAWADRGGLHRYMPVH